MIRNTVVCIALLTLALGSCTTAGPTATVTRDRSVVCPRASAPKIDGELDDSCWQTAPQIKSLGRMDMTGVPDAETPLHLACDDKALYIAFRCVEPRMANILSTDRSDIFMNDSVEVFLDADRDRVTYQHFIVDASGRRFQETAENVMENVSRTWSAPWQSAVVKENDGWNAEIAIPWSTLGVKPRQGGALRANFGRNRYSIREVSSWTYMPDGFHQPLMFGNIILDMPMTVVTSDLRLPAGISTENAKGTLILRNGDNKHTSVTPVVTALPARQPSPVTLPAVTVPTDTNVKCPFKLNLTASRLYSIDVCVKPEGVKSPVLVDSYQLFLPAPTLGTIGAVIGSADWGSWWEANATYKVLPDTKLPSAREKAIRINAAGNEFEPFQIVLTPKQELKNLRVSMSALKGPGQIASSDVSIRLVETVPVTIPTGSDSVPGDYPDPLPKFAPTNIPAGKNTALWLTVHVPADAKAGDYKGTLTLSADGVEPVSIPVGLHVWGFSLPKISYLRTAYGHDAGSLGAWHGAKTTEEKWEITRLLNQDFIDHRISPYNPMAFADPKIEITGGEVKIDWADFDKVAATALPYMNSFNVPFAWMSDFQGIKQGTPEYNKIKGSFVKQMARHFREKGWFDKAYIYIYDEPEPDVYQRIVDEIKLWRDADPAWQVLLTEQPEKKLAGQVNIYVPILPNYAEKDCQERQAAGDQVWWYVCCGPHHPYPNNFVDYPAIDHRIFHWMTWKYKVTGVLYWSTMWWQDNVWNTPMSYTPDRTGKWGNGDGHLLYPAVKEVSKTPLMEGPVDSIRWEMIREGVEDYDYLYMLNDAIKKAAGNPKKAKAVQAGKQALSKVGSLVRGRTDYEQDPRKLYAVRRQIAEALEQLKAR